VGVLSKSRGVLPKSRGVLIRNMGVCLYLVTLSNIDTTSYGIAEILDSNNDDLYYKFNVSPKAMNTNVIENLFQIIINRKL
jgi:hypothetical protein